MMLLRSDLTISQKTKDFACDHLARTHCRAYLKCTYCGSDNDLFRQGLIEVALGRVENTIIVLLQVVVLQLLPRIIGQAPVARFRHDLVVRGSCNWRRCIRRFSFCARLLLMLLSL